MLRRTKLQLNCSLRETAGGTAARRCARAMVVVATTLVPVTDAAAQPALSIADAGAGDYVHFGQIALASAENGGDTANLGVVVGRDAVAVIDTGGSVAVGEALLRGIAQITSRPVRYVINTHEHPDHVFGNPAFVGTGATFVGHRNMPGSLLDRAPYYLRTLRETLGDEAASRQSIVPPTLLVDSDMRLDLGNRSVLVTAWSPPAHSDCDLTVLDERTGLLFAGDLVFTGHVPVIDGSIKGWLALLPRLAMLEATHVVPGHGISIAPWPAALGDERRYLRTLEADVRAAIAAGSPLAQAVRRIGLSERGRWSLFDDYTPRNVTAAYGELEWD